MPARSDDASPTSDALLSSRQTLWILVAMLWLGVSVQQLVTGDVFLGVVGLLVGVGGGLYRVGNP